MYKVLVAGYKQFHVTVMCRLEGKSWKETVKETKQKFPATYEVVAS